MISQDHMDYIADVALLPFTLLINFSLFQYLVDISKTRLTQPWTVLLLMCAFVGFAALVPFSIPDERVFAYFNDVSETASTLTFLVQIVILGRDICKKIKIKTLVWITMLSQIIILIEILLILMTILKIIDERLHIPWIDDADKIMQAIALWFIFVFRFYYISMARGGFSKTLRTRRLEIFLYLLFATNEYPFAILTIVTGVQWDPVQACWHRLTLMMCILYTIHDKRRSSSSSNVLKTTRGAKSHVGRTTQSKLPTGGPAEGSLSFYARPSVSKIPTIQETSPSGLTKLLASMRRSKSWKAVQPSRPVNDASRATPIK